MTRLQSNVLPLLAVPFVPFEALKAGASTLAEILEPVALEWQDDGGLDI